MVAAIVKGLSKSFTAFLYGFVVLSLIAIINISAMILDSFLTVLSLGGLFLWHLVN